MYYMSGTARCWNIAVNRICLSLPPELPDTLGRLVD